MVELVPSLHQHKGNRKKGLNVAQCVCVCTHQGTTEGPEEWFHGRVCKFQAWLMSISEALLSPAALGGRRLSGGALKHNTPNEMWLAPPYCSIYTGWADIVRKDAKKRSPAVWWGLVALQTHGGVCVIFTLISKGVRENSAPHNHTSPLQRPRPPSPQRQRKTVDNYLVWNFLAVSVSATLCVGVTQLIFDCGFEDMQQGYCADACVGGALPGVKEHF